MSNNETFPISWEEVASALPRDAQDTERLMAAVYYRFRHETAIVSDVTTIANEHFRRARWGKPTNLAATANHCASRGWLSEAGQENRRKLWRITRRGYAHVESMLNGHEAD